MAGDELMILIIVCDCGRSRMIVIIVIPIIIIFKIFKIVIVHEVIFSIRIRTTIVIIHVIVTTSTVRVYKNVDALENCPTLTPQHPSQCGL